MVRKQKAKTPKSSTAARKAGKAPASKASKAPARKAGKAPAGKAGKAPAGKAGKAGKAPAGKAPAGKAGKARRSNQYAVDTGFLILPAGGESIELYVATIPSIGGNQGGFGLSKTGPFYTGGMSWAFGKTSLMVTFNLLEDIKQLSADASANVRFAPVCDCNRTQTALFPQSSTNESFLVQFTKGPAHDPQIIISPG